jgi:hypothetical protein
VGAREKETAMKHGIVTLRIVIGAYLLGLGVLAGVMIDRMWFDRQRSAVLQRYDEALRQWHIERMALEKRAMRRPER